MYKMSIKDETNFPIVSYPFVCINIPVTPPYGCLILQYDIILKSLKIPKGQSESVYRTLKRHISIGVFVVYIATGSPVRYIPSKSCDLADENNEILTEWK
jgi:hypothetical protein